MSRPLQRSPYLAFFIRCDWLVLSTFRSCLVSVPFETNQMRGWMSCGSLLHVYDIKDISRLATGSSLKIAKVYINFKYSATRSIWMAEYSLRKPKVFVLHILRRHLTKEGRVRNFFYCLIWIKEPCVQKFEGFARSKILGISQIK